jgi:essential recombination function protein|nr:MAG TPA: ERF superfamily protein [Caudoviricetes sp.]
MAGKAIYAALMAVQSELKAPKGQENTFGKYRYRSAEDILEAVKPLLKENGLYLRISDTVELIGDRYYVKATVTAVDIATGEAESATAYAREQTEKKGMDAAQVTGATSSYARKYALNALFGIDDTKDADTDEYTRTGRSGANQEQAKKQTQPPTQVQTAAVNDAHAAMKELTAEMQRINATKEEVAGICRKLFGKASSRELTADQLRKLTTNLAAEIMAGVA